MDQPRPRKVRRDSLRNRARLVAAANDLFASTGGDVALEEIAAEAGVGVATLYRHFPTKGDLVHAMLESYIEQLEDDAIQAAATPDPRLALRSFFVAAMVRQERSHVLLESIQRHGIAPEPRAVLIERLHRMLEPLVVLAHEAGVLAPDLDASDVLIALRMVGTAAGVADGAHPLDRYLDVVMRGLVAARD